MRVENTENILRVILGKNLIWEFHIDRIYSKNSSEILLIRRLSNVDGQNVQIIIYYRVLYEPVSYFIPWSGDKMQSNITQLQPTDYCQECFRILNIVPFTSLNIYQTILFV